MARGEADNVSPSMPDGLMRSPSKMAWEVTTSLGPDLFIQIADVSTRGKTGATGRHRGKITEARGFSNIVSPTRAGKGR